MDRVFQQWPEAVGSVDGFSHEDIPPAKLIILPWYYLVLHDIVSDGPHVLLSYKMVLHGHTNYGVVYLQWLLQ